MLRWILWIVAGLVGLVGLAAIVGLLLPKAHRASRTVTVPASPEKVFAIVTDFGRYASWRSDVRRVTVEGSGGTGTVVREENTSGTIPYRVEVFDPPSHLVMRIADPSLPFGGTWTYDLSPSPGGTTLTLTEDGEVYNPFFRVMQKFFFSPYKTIDTFLANLARTITS